MKFIKTFHVLLIVTLLIPIFVNAQEKEVPKSSKKELIKAAKEIMQSTKTCALITIDDEDRPRVRTMDPFSPEEDLTVWLGTNSSSRKVIQLKNDNRVTLYYADKDDTGYVMIHGIASIVYDVAEKEKHWKKEWEEFYPNYPKDYLLIKVSPEWMEILSTSRNILGDSKTWEPQRVTF